MTPSILSAPTTAFYEYDDLGRMTSRLATPAAGSDVEAPTAAESFDYDAMSNLISASNDDAVVTRKYASTVNLLEDSILFDGDATAQDVGLGAQEEPREMRCRVGHGRVDGDEAEVAVEGHAPTVVPRAGEPFA